MQSGARVAPIRPNHGSLSKLQAGHYYFAVGCQCGQIAAWPGARSVNRYSRLSVSRIRYNCRTPSRFDPYAIQRPSGRAA